MYILPRKQMDSSFKINQFSCEITNNEVGNRLSCVGTKWKFLDSSSTSFIELETGCTVDQLFSSGWYYICPDNETCTGIQSDDPDWFYIQDPIAYSICNSLFVSNSNTFDS